MMVEIFVINSLSFVKDGDFGHINFVNCDEFFVVTVTIYEAYAIFHFGLKKVLFCIKDILEITQNLIVGYCITHIIKIFYLNNMFLFLLSRLVVFIVALTIYLLFNLENGEFKQLCKYVIGQVKIS